jgi:hypothetical protein
MSLAAVGGDENLQYMIEFGIAVPLLIFGVVLTIWGIDQVFFLAGMVMVSLADLIPFMPLISRGRKLIASLSRQGIRACGI